MRRLLLVASATLLLAVLSAASALAGGMAISILDPLPTSIEAGQTYKIGYTIKQHGIEPVDVARFGGTTEIVAWTADMSQHLRFPGRPEGERGHYVADVTLPTAGRWSWEVTQGPFRPHPLGELVVRAPAPAPAPAAPAAAPAPAAPRLPGFVTPLLVASTAGLLAAMLFANRRERRLAGSLGG